MDWNCVEKEPYVLKCRLLKEERKGAVIDWSKAFLRFWGLLGSLGVSWGLGIDESIINGILLEMRQGKGG